MRSATRVIQVCGVVVSSILGLILRILAWDAGRGGYCNESFVEALGPLSGAQGFIWRPGAGLASLGNE